MMFVTRAAEILLRGGIIAYPTEGVFGLGCLPDDVEAVERLLEVKRRDTRKGLILIASIVDPVTWIVPPGPSVHPIILGQHENLAIRITSNPIAAALCDAVDSPIVSSSANLSGKPTARNRIVLRRQFGARVDYIVPGDCGPASGASEIRDLSTGKVLRPR
jgi:L-threonylcarbamoyladenylate synthase